MGRECSGIFEAIEEAKIKIHWRSWKNLCLILEQGPTALQLLYQESGRVFKSFYHHILPHVQWPNLQSLHYKLKPHDFCKYMFSLKQDETCINPATT